MRQAVGEYYLASSFEKIFVQRTGFVGLTGIGVDRVFIKRFLDKYGIKPQIFAREVGCCWYSIGPQRDFIIPEMLIRMLN